MHKTARLGKISRGILISGRENCSGVIVVDNNQNCNVESSLTKTNCFRPSYSLSDISPSNPTRKPIVLVQWEDAKQFFNAWTCKPNQWECKIGIASTNSSFSTSETSNVLPKLKCEAVSEQGIVKPCIPNQNFVRHGKLFGVRSSLNLKCYWGGKACAKWTNRIIQQSSCDDPELGHLDLDRSTDRFCDNDMQTQLDWILLGNRRIGNTKLITRTNRRIWALSTLRWIKLKENYDQIDQLIKTCDDKTENNPGWSKCSRLDDEIIREHHRYCAVTNGKTEKIYAFEEAIPENDPSCSYSYY